MQADSAKQLRPIAAFTMEIGLESRLPTYSGGLGVLAGDTAKGAADLGLPFSVVTLVHRKGYFQQSIGDEGLQEESSDPWDPSAELEEVDARAHIDLEGRRVDIRAWRYEVAGVQGHSVPVYFLDTDLETNHEEDRRITDHLYGGDSHMRLRQEAVLGIGGVRLLRALGRKDIATFHMNEGHSALLALELLREAGASRSASSGEVQALMEGVRQQCVFTTHTPVPAGHDRFPIDLIRKVLGSQAANLLKGAGSVDESGEVNMTRVALAFARYTNGVALRHGQVSREMFPGHTIDSITNGVHARTWTGPAFQRLFDKWIPGWRLSPYLMRHAVAIPLEEIRAAHAEARKTLLDEVHRRSGRRLNPDALTVVFARRAAPYKRADLLVADPDRLRAVAQKGGAIQFIYAGKAHPRDSLGKELIRRVVQAGKELGDSVPIVYLEDYDMELGGLLTAGADLWLNQPRKPLEASGTSGMKAAMNGVPCLSIQDGWWIEGHVEGVTGWSIDGAWQDPVDDAAELTSILTKLERVILPLFHRNPDGWAQVMRASIALNGAHFHMERMLQEYVDRAFRV